MKELTKLICIAVLPALLFMTSCSMEKRVHRKGFHISSSIFKNNKKLIKKEALTQKKEISRVEEELAENHDYSRTGERVYAEMSNSLDPSTSGVLASGIENQPNLTRPQKSSALKNDVETKRQTHYQKKTSLRKVFKKTPSERSQKNPKRKTAIVTGASLLLMAILAGVSMPALGTVMASIGLVGIFLLDLLVAFGVVKYHKKEKPKLAKASGLLRLLYTAFLGVAVGYHIAGSVSMFNKLWGIGLIFFGIHLISLGLMYDNEGGKKWVKYLIKSLLIIAGIGYIISYVGILVVANPIAFEALMETIFIVPMILGEMFYALWMLFKGGKSV